MKRKMVFIGISYTIGLFCAFNFGKTVLLAIVCIAFIAFSVFLKRKKYSELICCILCFLFGFGYYVVYDYTHFSQLYEYDGKSAKISGKVVDLSENGDTVTLTVDGKVDNVDAKVLLYADNTNVQTGDEVEAYGRLDAFESSYIFDTKGYYNSKGIILCVYNPVYMYVYEGEFSLVNVVNTYVESVKQSFRRLLPNEAGDLLCAMLFGDKSGLDQSGKTAFYRSGIGHIMATSGLHLVIIISMLTLLPFLRKNPVIKSIAILVAGAVFVVCAEFSVSVIRAYIMLAISSCAPLFFKKSDSLNSLCISIVLMTVPAPYIISSPSFVLSVFGVLCSGVFAPYLCEGLKSDLLKPLAYASCVSICIIPASTLYFDEISLISPITNVLLIPLCTFALCCGAIAFIFANAMFIAKPLLILGGFACNLVNAAVKFLASLDFASIAVENKYLLMYIWLAFLGLVVYYMINNEDKKRLNIVALAILCMLFVSGTVQFFVDKSHFTAVYSDSSGTVCIVKNENGISIIDGGARQSTDFAIKYLSSIGIYDIDSIYLVCDANSARSKWEYSAANFELGNFYDCTNGYTDENVDVYEKERYAVFTRSYSLCVINDAKKPIDGCDYGYLLGDDSAQGYICQNSVTGFVIKENSNNVRIDYLEKVQEE